MIRDLRNWRKAWEFNKKSWHLFRKKVNFRYWLLWSINMFAAYNIVFWLDLANGFSLKVITVILLYFAVSPLSLVLWLPHYIKQKKPMNYNGVIMSIGEWIGLPYRV
ncbi:hypothetical protein [Candidatus Contubernalis alkaliaceticus]|uniref:hypothetical protein n=1 Tax=Candidatus Contubernalis alkaliaceticus TaxID=338645 RepID=UPI001F4C194A|nr:hypothetical protein [Candidatus Contubernalis alkalaceticus]UNC92200.1 hypothetical protein HUE98_08915 [Candidatus Contubernalis alkalaceticus]